MIENLAKLRQQLIADKRLLPNPKLSGFDLKETDPCRLNRLSLEQQRKRAIELLHLVQTGQTKGHRGLRKF